MAFHTLRDSKSHAYILCWSESFTKAYHGKALQFGFRSIGSTFFLYLLFGAKLNLLGFNILNT